MIVDTDRITQAIIGTGCGPLAMEEGAACAQAWIEDEEGFSDRIVAVEAGFSMQVDTLTWIVGVMDLVCRDENGFYGREHKTTRGPSKWWNERKWLEEISSGHQIAVYALALREAEFYQPEGKKAFDCIQDEVMVRVKAVTKTNPPAFWGKEDGWCSFKENALMAVKNAFIVKAEAIRAARKRGVIPWQLTGSHCYAYGRNCEYYDACRAYTWPEIQTGFDGGDPAAKFALPYLPDEAKHPEAVILSASAYSDWSRCAELGRQNAQSGNKEESMALQTGSVFHAAVAEWYRQVKEEQDAKNQ